MLQGCAHLIRSRKGRELFAYYPVPTTKGLQELQFLAAYSYYMAGENIKDQLERESSGYHNSTSINVLNAVSPTSPRNPYLTDLYHELMSLYLIDRSYRDDSETIVMDGFVMHIFGLVIRDLNRGGFCSDHFNPRVNGGNSETLTEIPCAKYVLTEALIRNPGNWSCWLDLADVCLKEELLHLYGHLKVLNVRGTMRCLSIEKSWDIICISSFLFTSIWSNS